MIQGATKDIQGLIYCGYFDSSNVDYIELDDDSLWLVAKPDQDYISTGYYNWIVNYGTAYSMFGPYPNKLVAMYSMTGEMPEGEDCETGYKWLLEAQEYFEWDEEEFKGHVISYLGEEYFMRRNKK